MDLNEAINKFYEEEIKGRYDIDKDKVRKIIKSYFIAVRLGFNMYSLPEIIWEGFGKFKPSIRKLEKELKRRYKFQQEILTHKELSKLDILEINKIITWLAVRYNRLNKKQKVIAQRIFSKYKDYIDTELINNILNKE